MKPFKLVPGEQVIITILDQPRPPHYVHLEGKTYKEKDMYVKSVSRTTGNTIVYVVKEGFFDVTRDEFDVYLLKRVAVKLTGCWYEGTVFKRITDEEMIRNLEDAPMAESFCK